MKKLWLTLIEILIALFIFGVGILSILSMITKNLWAIDTIRLQSQSTFFAKEWLELIENLRDSMALRGRKRNCLLENTGTDLTEETLCSLFALGTGQTSQIVRMWLDQNGVYAVMPYEGGTDFDSLFSAARLFYHTGLVADRQTFWYDYDQTGKPTEFARYLLFSGFFSQPDAGILSPDMIIKVQSVVLFRRGSKTGQTILETFLSQR